MWCPYYNTGCPYADMGTEYGQPRYLLNTNTNHNLKLQ